jgi:hypothetical protein
MAYTILNTDGSTLVLLADGKIDQSTTSLTLIGKNYSGFGEYYNNNLIKLLANSASTSGSPPRSPLTGQLWYDTTARRLMVYDNSFKSVSGAIVSATQPGNLSTGDLWWDTTNNQLKLWGGLSAQVIGPAFPKDVGLNGWGLPVIKVQDSNNNSKNITVLRNYGQTLGYISNEQFTVNTSTNYTYLTSGTTTATVKGLTILGDIQYTGKISNKYLSIEVDFATLYPTKWDMTTADETDRQAQNSAICNVLDAMFPINLGSTTMQNAYSAGTLEVGVPIFSQCRVLCRSSSFQGTVPPGNTIPGNPRMYQVRLFEASRLGAVGRWYSKSTSTGVLGSGPNIIAQFTATNTVL